MAADAALQCLVYTRVMEARSVFARVKICASLIKYCVELFCGGGQVSETLLVRCGIVDSCRECVGYFSS